VQSSFGAEESKYKIRKDVAKNESVEGSQVAMASMRSRGRCARAEVSSFGGCQVGMGRGVCWNGYK